MATIIDLPDGGFIAGDPPTELAEGHHWCSWCRGEGIEFDYDGEWAICTGCWGVCTVACEGCDDHPASPTA